MANLLMEKETNELKLNEDGFILIVNSTPSNVTDVELVDLVQKMESDEIEYYHILCDSNVFDLETLKKLQLDLSKEDININITRMIAIISFVKNGDTSQKCLKFNSTFEYEVYFRKIKELGYQPKEIGVTLSDFFVSPLSTLLSDEIIDLLDDGENLSNYNVVFNKEENLIEIA